MHEDTGTGLQNSFYLLGIVGRDFEQQTFIHINKKIKKSINITNL